MGIYEPTHIKAQILGALISKQVLYKSWMTICLHVYNGPFMSDKHYLTVDIYYLWLLKSFWPLFQVGLVA